MVNQILFFNCIHVESEEVAVVKSKVCCLDEAARKVYKGQTGVGGQTD